MYYTGVAASLQRLCFGVSALDDSVTLEEAGVEEVRNSCIFLGCCVHWIYIAVTIECSGFGRFFCDDYLDGDI